MDPTRRHIVKTNGVFSTSDTAGAGAVPSAERMGTRTVGGGRLAPLKGHGCQSVETCQCRMSTHTQTVPCCRMLTFSHFRFLSHPSLSPSRPVSLNTSTPAAPLLCSATTIAPLPCSALLCCAAPVAPLLSSPLLSSGPAGPRGRHRCVRQSHPLRHWRVPAQAGGLVGGECPILSDIFVFLLMNMISSRKSTK